MTFWMDLFKGKAGLAKTYWLWYVLGGAVLTAGYYASTFAAIKNFNNPFIFNVLSYGYPIFQAAWIVFFSIAVINSASYNRKRGGWGWVASILAVIGILKALQMMAVLFGLTPTAWNDFEKGVRAENLGLPVQIEKNLALTRMSTNWKDKSLTYHYQFDYQTLNKNTFNVQKAKDASLESCGEYKEMLGRPVKKIILEFKANDKTKAEIEILPEDCGF